MNDMSATIAPKSDQLNADDLIGGPRVITVREVRIQASRSDDQPVSVYFEGDDNKPFKPCKIMRRVMMEIWGADANNYIGRSMQLYRDPNVTFGGKKVGGIRISHFTDLEQERTLSVTISKARREPYVVKPLQVQARPGADDGNQKRLQDSARAAAKNGKAALTKHINGLSDSDWNVVGQIKAELLDIAKKADAAPATSRSLDDDTDPTPTPEQIAAAQQEAEEYAKRQAEEAGAV